MSDAAVCEALDPHGAAWDAPRVVVHATTWMPILAAMVGTSLTGPACRGAAGRSFAAGSRRRWHRPDQCRASVGGSRLFVWRRRGDRVARRCRLLALLRSTGVLSSCPI